LHGDFVNSAADSVANTLHIDRR